MSNFLSLFFSLRFTEFLEPFERVIQPEELWLYKNPLVESDLIPKRVMFVSHVFGLMCSASVFYWPSESVFTGPDLSSVRVQEGAKIRGKAAFGIHKPERVRSKPESYYTVNTGREKTGGKKDRNACRPMRSMRNQLRNADHTCKTLD